MSDNMVVETPISRHAYKRAKERLGWKKSTLERMLQRVVKEGDDVTELRTGSFGSWVREREIQSRYTMKLIVYQETLFVFAKGDMTLVTVFRIPNKYLRKYVHKTRRG